MQQPSKDMQNLGASSGILLFKRNQATCQTEEWPSFQKWCGFGGFGGCFRPRASWDPWQKSCRPSHDVWTTLHVATGLSPVSLFCMFLPSWLLPVFI